MGIVLYNGDSFTYGDELDGSRNPKGHEFDTHQPHTYAYKLSNHLGRKYINLAQNGSSNMKIFRTTLDFLHKSSKDIDLLVITWSSWGRFEICEPMRIKQDIDINIPQECNMNQIIPSHRSRSGKLLWEIGDREYAERSDILKLYTENVLSLQTQIMHGLMYMKHIQWLCDKLGIACIQGVIHADLWKNILHSLKSEGYEDYQKEISHSLEFLRDECKVGMGRYTDLYTLAHNRNRVKPMGHADEDSHSDYALILYEIIKNKGLIDVTN